MQWITIDTSSLDVLFELSDQVFSDETVTNFSVSSSYLVDLFLIKSFLDITNLLDSLIFIETTSQQ